MSLVKKFLFGLGGAALMVTGVASTASAHDPIGAGDYCELYAREYAAVHAPSFAGWDMAYRHAFNECITGGPTFVSARPFAGPYGLAGAALAAPLGVANAAVHATLTTASALAIPAVALQPFTSEWHAYCAAKYRSFDPTTGMYLAYSGAHRMCR